MGVDCFSEPLFRTSFGTRGLLQGCSLLMGVFTIRSTAEEVSLLIRAYNSGELTLYFTFSSKVLATIFEAVPLTFRCSLLMRTFTEL
jgi:hypothetical protein